MKAVQLKHGTYSRGVIFSDSYVKHEVLDDFLAQQPFENQPNHLVFCDDRSENCVGILHELKHPVTRTVYHYFPLHSIPVYLIHYDNILRAALHECKADELQIMSPADAITAYQIYSFLQSKGTTINLGSLLEFWFWFP